MVSLKHSLNGLGLFILLLMTSGCQMGYLLSSAYHQVDLLARRVDIGEVLQDEIVSKEVKSKLKLSQEAIDFSVNHLGLNGSKNYRSFVQLRGPYVTYVVSAAPKDRLEHYIWSFPIVGEIPYKGYFNEEDARSEAAMLTKRNLDTYIRGISAYSTLGWFNDPILSSMIAYDDYDLVNLIIHETVHATIYIKSQADFNERLATFVGDQGATLFFRQREGVDSPTLEHAKLRSADTKAFSLFISKEIENLKSYYEEQKTPIAEEKRQQLFSEIVKRFDSQLKPNLKTDSYLRFGSKPLNNARLLAFQTYLKDLKNFETAFKHLGEDFSRLMKLCKALEAAPDPEKMLADIAKTGIGDSMPF